MDLANTTHMESNLEFTRALTSAKEGDAEALGQVCRECYPRVSELVHQRLDSDLRRGRPWLLSRFSTGDVVQEVFFQLVRDLSGFAGDTRDELISYLAASVKNRLLDAIRFHEAGRRDGRLTVGPGEQRFLSEQNHGPGTDAMLVEQRAKFMAALDGLSPQESALVKDRLLEDVSFRELAERHGYSSLFAARRAFYAAEALLVIELDEGENS